MPRNHERRNASSTDALLKRIGTVAVLTYSTLFTLDNVVAQPLATAYIQRILPDVDPDMSASISSVATQAFDKDTSVTCTDFSRLEAETSERQIGGVTISKRINIMPFGSRLGIDPVALPQYSRPSRFYLSERICSDVLSAFDGITDTDSERYRQTHGLFAMFHEEQHVEGVRNEAEASCNALQKMPEYLTKLRFSDRAVRGIIRTTTQEYYSWMSGEYVDTAKCRPGGEYDLGVDGPFALPPKRVYQLP